MSEGNFEVALTKCYFCNGDHQIVMNSRLTKPYADKVRELHGKVMDMQPCTKCEEMMKQGVMLITVDNEKSGPGWNKPPADLDERKHWIPNPYRTGGFFVLRDEAVTKAFDPAMAEFALKHRWMFIEDAAARMMGLFDLAPKESVEQEG